MKNEGGVGGYYIQLQVKRVCCRVSSRQHIMERVMKRLSFGDREREGVLLLLFPFDENRKREREKERERERVDK